jgi:hypothetical protein
MSLLTDLWNTIHGILTSSGMIMLVIGALIVLAAGFMMQNFGSIVTTTFVALLAFALAGYVEAVVVGHQNASAFATTEWNSFLALHMLTLLAFTVLFGVLIAVVHLVRSLVLR